MTDISSDGAAAAAGGSQTAAVPAQASPPSVDAPVGQSPLISEVTVGAHFKMIFITVVGFTAAFWVAYFSLVTFGGDSEQVKGAIDTFKIAGFSGIGTIFGLFGGVMGAKT
ncbi:hypothetical protein ACFVZ3_14910 [Kitasatospora purpeofusca]|uniref:hypothetical protein n=1 Tax=Kitasatospora purpeofusca TaxID=67352 RepID=UPI0036A1DF7A